MKLLWIISALLIFWLMLAKNCMTMREPDDIAEKKFARQGIKLVTGTIMVNGHRLHYARTGNDSLPTLFFIHGSPGSWNAFERYLMDPDLLARFRMVSIDRPGFGYSDFGNAEHLDRQSMLISPIFKNLDNHKKCYIAGHSLGGPLVIKLVADNSTIFSGAVIISGSIDPDEEEPEKWRPFLYRTPLNFLVPGALRPANEELWYLKKDLVNLKADFNKITCPVYFVHGALDSWVPPGNVKYGKKMLVHSKSISVTLIDSANHFIPWNKFDQVKQVLLRIER
jgi:pimeloyl-ACP methyl ester carboxylesterase